jgi:SAM-dependent methyltransferase
MWNPSGESSSEAARGVGAGAQAPAPNGAAPGDAEACPACAARDWQTLFEARAFPIGRCRRCGLVRTLGAGDDGGAQYPPFDQRETAVVRAMRFAVAQLLRERLALVRRLRPAGRLLDFGCGSGSFARLAAHGGYDVVGLEPFSLGRPHEEPGLRLVRAPLEESRPSLGRFDVITLWQVLEHVRDPGRLLETLLEHLEPAGVLVVSVPNFASWQSRVFGAGWFHLDPPRHISHFDHATLRALVDRLGLEVLSERTFHLEYGPVGWLQSALNRLLPRSNFLYEFVKDRGALAGVPASQTALNLALSVVGAAALAAPALAVEAAAGLARAGAVLTIAARKKPTG